MAVIVRLKAGINFQDADPKNWAYINPVFKVEAIFDGDSLCDNLATTMASNLTGLGAAPLKIRSYDVQGTPPVFPNGKKDVNITGTPKDPTTPPELAVCLSFYAGQNQPRRRGRMYLPYWLVGGTVGNIGKVIGTAERTNAKNFATALGAMGGANVEWGVWSEVDNTFRAVTNVFVSDAWATVRSRGIKETARTTAAVTG